MNTEHKPVYRIADMAEAERPRERLEKLGADKLSSAELLAILLRVGVTGESAVQVGQRLLKKFGELAGLQRVPLAELCTEHGIGLAKAAQIKAAIELGRRFAQQMPDERAAIHSPGEAAALVQYEMGVLEQEELRVILLDVRNRLVVIDTVCKGSVNSSQVRVGEVFCEAVRRKAVSIIVVHNHPSGDPTPSPDDVAITRAIVQAGKLLDIDVLDHLVIGRGPGQFVSLKERGLGFG